MSPIDEIFGQLDGWVNDLARPYLPHRAVELPGGGLRLEFRHRIPHAVLVGKLVRAVSGLRAALELARMGYVAECAALLRIVSDFGTEVKAVAEALNRGGDPPRAVTEFVNQYFTPKPRTPEEYFAAERVRYVSREELMKAEVRFAEGTSVDGEKVRAVRQFLNHAYDSYVHGSEESSMELCNPATGLFEMQGRVPDSKRAEFIEAVNSKLHEVVVAIELTAAVSGDAEVFKEARNARHQLDQVSSNDTNDSA